MGKTGERGAGHATLEVSSAPWPCALRSGRKRLGMGRRFDGSYAEYTRGELSGRTSPVQLHDTWVLSGRDRSMRVGTGIDWILTTDDTGLVFDVTDASVPPGAMGASDHLPITATLR